VLHTLLDWYNGKNAELKEFEVGNEAEWKIVSLIN